MQKAAGQRWCPGCISDGNCVKVQVVGIILGTIVLIPDSQGAALQFAQLTLHGVTMVQISGVMLSQKTALQCIYGSVHCLCIWQRDSCAFGELSRELSPIGKTCKGELVHEQPELVPH